MGKVGERQKGLDSKNSLEGIRNGAVGLRSPRTAQQGARHPKVVVMVKQNYES